MRHAECTGEVVRIATLARNGVRASFADEATKAELEQGIAAWLASPE